MRDVLSWLRAIPQALLVEQEQLSYDVAYGLALIPTLALGVLYFRRPAALLIALCFLTGIVCLLALRLCALTVGLPAWVGHRANHPLVASLLVACFLPSTVTPWVGVAMVALLVLVGSLLWPQLHRMMVHPALLVFGIAYLIQRQLQIGFVNPFDLHPLDDPLSLWYRLRIVIDPVKLYVGNVPGPLGATSVGALLLGLAYLWYTRKISLGLILGFLVGVAAGAIALRTDVAFQVSSGPALFVAGYVAADRRRLNVDERGALLIGALAGLVTMILRNDGQGQQAAWEGLLAAGALATLILRIVSMIAGRAGAAPAVRTMRRLTVQSNRHPAPAPSAAPAVPAPALTPLRPQPVAATTASVSLRTPPAARPRTFAFEESAGPNDIVRQMRSAAAHRSIATDPGSLALWALALLVFNPAGLWMTWTTVPISRPLRIAISVVSIVWYAALTALVLALLHRL
ncbi:MAG TPA: RnfABCDGE type electron transport complex subunit D [Candidatus Limnocylindrales bacterium]|nr:RnfABCDGE type electron transport complex subunit D [Candidatus Limnocylindrales bacterium]